jgi:hypothetical protein
MLAQRITVHRLSNTLHQSTQQQLHRQCHRLMSLRKIKPCLFFSVASLYRLYNLMAVSRCKSKNFNTYNLYSILPFHYPMDTAPGNNCYIIKFRCERFLAFPISTS